MKRIIALVLVVSAWSFATIGMIGGCGSGSSANNGGGNNTGGNPEPVGSKSWSESGSALTIDDIVNGNGSGSALTANTKSVRTSPSEIFYYGRFLFTDGSNLFTGAVKFKVNKQDDSSAYFSDFSLEHMSVVSGYETHTDIDTQSVDLGVNAAFDPSNNDIQIANATERFVAFDVDFGNNTFFGDVHNAGVIFTSDFTTMAGGDNNSFFFIAQKADSQPDVTLSSILGDFTVVDFIVDSSGNILVSGPSAVTVGGLGGNGFTAFRGTSSSGSYDGELSLTDATSGSFLFGFGSNDGTATALGVNGAFLMSADTSLVLGIDATTGNYFAAERAN